MKKLKILNSNTEYKNYLQSAGYSDSSIISLEYVLKRFSAWLGSYNISISRVDYFLLMEYIKNCRERNNCSRTIQIVVNGLSIFFNYLIHKGLITHNPCKLIQIRGAKKFIAYKILTPDELNKLYCDYASLKTRNNINLAQTVQKRNAVILGLVVFQALQLSEINQIKISNIDLKKGRICITGNKRCQKRELLLHISQLYDMIEYIENYRQNLIQSNKKESDQLILNFRGKPENEANAKVFLKSYNAFSKFQLRQVRASVIVSWLANFDLRKVQYMVGHKHVSSTEYYLSLNYAEIRDDLNLFHPL